MLLQIVSDIHLEYRKNRYPFINRRAPNIALLGDIGKPFSHVYQRLIADLSRRFERVILIAGNHEYYRTGSHKVTVSEVQEQLRKTAAMYDNVCFLEQQCTFIDGVRILGATLWSHIPPEQWRAVRKKINDYTMIYIHRYDDDDDHTDSDTTNVDDVTATEHTADEHADNHATQTGTATATPARTNCGTHRGSRGDGGLGVNLAPEHTSYWHDSTVQWLKRELAAPGLLATPTIVLTHHAPYTHNTSDPRFRSSPLHTAYATNLESLFHPPLVAWAYGHTHYPSDMRVRDIRLVSNPVGYPGELSCEETATRSPPLLFVETTPNIIRARKK